ncbi:MAG: GNAT family N-acetyltransferase [Phycisphaerales bacterium]|nr:GNAT family N-acetyltransferase [Phycisphaerales bacterium]MCB9857082.1 GNAT family N-acetyltransferase [Phycisphaerales bacterium]MCB9861791.1 GNAT family N-acetyltransferase [Phycisphaerales bacterium]
MNSALNIEYRVNAPLDLDAMIDLYRSSTLGDRRPVGERDRMRRMRDEANLCITAWDAAKLVGIARTMTDFSYVAYLSDLAVDLDYQRRGIGRMLIEETRAALEPKCMIVLLAAPQAVDYYPNVGFARHESAWILRPQQDA